jgi:hypothetical protein
MLGFVSHNPAHPAACLHCALVRAIETWAAAQDGVVDSDDLLHAHALLLADTLASAPRSQRRSAAAAVHNRALRLAGEIAKERSRG